MAEKKKKIWPMNQSSIINRQSSIYILHGWTYTLDRWGRFAKELEAKDLKANLLKIPGLTEEIDRPWIMEDYVSWLSKKIKSEKNIILIGHSNGGRIAMAFSMKYPNKVSKLILIDSAGIYHNELYIKLKRKVFNTIAKTGRKLGRMGIARDFLYFLTGEKDYKEASENMKKTMINLLKFDKTLKAEKISIPTIIIWGKKDSITPVVDGKILNKKIADSKLYILKNSRHSPQFTHPKEVIDIILKNI